jgi:hypothetical protein
VFGALAKQVRFSPAAAILVKKSKIDPEIDYKCVAPE